MSAAASKAPVISALRVPPLAPGPESTHKCPVSSVAPSERDLDVRCGVDERGMERRDQAGRDVDRTLIAAPPRVPARSTPSTRRPPKSAWPSSRISRAAGVSAPPTA